MIQVNQEVLPMMIMYEIEIRKKFFFHHRLHSTFQRTPLAVKDKGMGNAELIQRLKSLGLTQSDIQVTSSSTLLKLSCCFLFS